MKEKHDNVNNSRATTWEEVTPREINLAAFLAAFHGGPYGLRSFA